MRITNIIFLNFRFVYVFQFIYTKYIQYAQ